jgi:hypothetical protein
MSNYLRISPKKSGLVFDEVLVETFHGELRGHCARFDGAIDTSIKTEFPLPFKGQLSDKVEITSIHPKF